MVAACGATAPGVRQARQLYEHGDYAGAERAADRELARSPDHPALWRLKIDAAIRGGHTKRGVDLYMKWHHQRRHYDEPLLRTMAVSTLWRALGHADAAVRAQALQEIERLGLAELHRRVKELLTDASDPVAAMAAVMLAAKDEQARHRIAALWQSKHAQVQAALVAGLGHAFGDRAHNELLAALGHASPEVRRAAVQALGRDLSSDDHDQLLHIARHDADGRVRAAALQALARTRSDKVFATARDALVDPYLGARLAGLTLLARWPEKSRALLAEIAGSNDLYVALRAAVALRKAGGEAPMQTLQWALAHPNWTIRVAALNALAEATSNKVALALLDPLLGDERLEVRLAAARVLVRAGMQGRAAGIFADALQAPRDQPRVQAAIDLLRMHDHRGSEALIRLANSPSASTRRAVAAAHRYTGNPTLPLVAALGDAAAEVRIEAAATLLWLLNQR